ncbi:protoporphyrinogen oxidase [Paenibacillus koleovorans]|uniref:protoporphyrinogen oxidase n=1 Tax=Paenibacillus koleovorans TaxID=121608 RepID=UPI000FD8AE50|nr:protoporphyrinogen oxidase [Paenibacillus koleovorans]
MKLVIVGGGITGLSTAFYARKYLKEAGLEAEVQLLEKSGRLGGRIETLRKDGFVIEKGPDSFLARKLPIVDLARELGMEEELTGTNPQAKKTYILHRGKLHRMPQGLVLGIPTEWSPFLKTGLISSMGKARAAMDLMLPKRTGTEDESLGDFLERRLGREVLEHIAEPLLAGIYAGDTYSLSLAATFPQFRQVELKHRSLILGMMASRKEGQALPGLPAAAKNSLFLTFKGGLAALVERLQQSLAEIPVIGRGVTAIERQPEGAAEGRYLLRLDGGEAGDENRLQADAIVLTLPAPAAGRLLPGIAEAEHLRQMKYVSVANVIMAFNAGDIEKHLDGSGFVIPRKEGTTITACTWTSSKWLHTAPPGKVLMRCYVGRSGQEDWTGWSDEELKRRVLHDLRRLHGIEAEPLFAEITRLPHSMPQYPVGHLQALRQFRERMSAELPGIWAVGGGFEGVGLPDCIRQGRDAARQAVDDLLARRAGEPIPAL